MNIFGRELGTQVVAVDLEILRGAVRFGDSPGHGCKLRIQRLMPVLLDGLRVHRHGCANILREHHVVELFCPGGAGTDGGRSAGRSICAANARYLAGQVAIRDGEVAGPEERKVASPTWPGTSS
jgi:hypothetical protein